MFKRVETDWELARFNDIWTTVWKEKGYELEYSDEVLERYVAIAGDGTIAGTAEIKPYRLNGSAINRVAPFARHPKIADNPGQIAEIDKMAVLPQYRGKLVSDLLSSAVYCAERYRFRYFVSLLEPVFFRALRISYRVPMEKIGEKTYYKGDDVIPVIFEMEEIYTHKSKYDWLVPARLPEALAPASLNRRAQ